MAGVPFCHHKTQSAKLKLSEWFYIWALEWEINNRVPDYSVWSFHRDGRLCRGVISVHEQENTEVHGHYTARENNVIHISSGEVMATSEGDRSFASWIINYIRVIIPYHNLSSALIGLYKQEKSWEHFYMLLRSKNCQWMTSSTSQLPAVVLRSGICGAVIKTTC